MPENFDRRFDDLTAFAANGFQPLSEAQIAAVAGPALPFPATIQTLPDQGRPAVTGFRS